jgi:PST family polysaccharide transporter
MLWMGGMRLTTQILDQVFTLVLVRILAPGDFGLMAMAGVFTSLFNMFQDMGLARALVQRQEVDEEYLSTAFWGNVASGLTLYVVSLAGAELVADFFDQPMVRLLFSVLALRFVFAGFSTTPEALFARKMRFSTVTLRNGASVIVGGFLGVGIALAGGGVWSLVAQSLGSAFARMLLLWGALSWRPKRIFSWAKFRDLWNFGSRVLGARIFNYVIKQFDTVLIGKTLGPALLGYYAFAYAMFLAPSIDIGLIVGRVTFSAFSRLQQDLQKLRRGFLLTTRYISFFAFPALLGFLLVAPDAVPVIFGPKWVPAVPALRVLLIAGMLQSHANIWTSVFQAMGRPDWVFKWAVASACVYVPAFVIGLRWGIVGVAGGYTASTLVLMPIQLSLVRRLLAFGWREYLNTLLPVAAATLAMGGCVLVVQAALASQGVGAPVRLVAAVGTGIISYLIAIALIQRELMTGLVRLLIDLRGRRARVLVEEGA